MLFNQTTFVGIDPTAGSRPMTYAAVDHELRLLALGEGAIEDVTAFVGGQESVYVAVCSPRRPNLGKMKQEAIRESLSPVPHPERWTGFRVAEYLLYKMNIRTPRTPGEAGRCPAWMQTGFEMYKRLERLGFQDFPSDEAKRKLLEIYPHAAYTVLLKNLPLPKNSLEGRIQRQLALHSRQMDVTDPMRIFEEITRYRLMQGILPLENLFEAVELDALIAAYTAWLAATNPEDITLIGNPEEGQVALPTTDLKTKYS